MVVLLILLDINYNTIILIRLQNVLIRKGGIAIRRAEKRENF